MLPKKSKDFIAPAAKKLNLPVDLVDDVISFYYSALRKALVNMQHYNIQVECLGSFKLKDKELNKLLAKYDTYLTSLRTKDTFGQMQIRKEVEAKYEKAIALHVLFQEERTRKFNYYRMKNEKFKRNLASQKRDNQGDNQLNI